jgi:hypothetical protein
LFGKSDAKTIPVSGWVGRFASDAYSTQSGYFDCINMLSVDECKKYLDDPSLSDKQVAELRDYLYTFIEQGMDFVFSVDTVSNCKDKNENPKK